jgi:hypothetical protein
MSTVFSIQGLIVRLDQETSSGLVKVMELGN